MKNWTPCLTTTVLLIAGLALGADAPQLNDPQAKASYGIGANLGKGLRRDSVPVNVDLVIQGFKDSYAGQELPMGDDEIRSALQAYWKETREKLAAKNLAAGKAFLDENKTKAGVVTLPSGLQYKVLQEGKGNSPAATDVATVHYRGTLVDGTEFDSSYGRGAPSTFGVNQVIRGWSEALQLMKPGSKWQLFIPSDLAYGVNGKRNSSPPIPPNATLLFEVELLSFKAAEPPAAKAPTQAPQVVTSDIIRVPSKEEMEKGAQIEVIKKEDVDEYIEKQKSQEKAEEKKD
jgi:FKBP-type peptidyl-prolyl cis-trans isomerase FklB